MAAGAVRVASEPDPAAARPPPLARVQAATVLLSKRSALRVSCRSARMDAGRPPAQSRSPDVPTVDCRADGRGDTPAERRLQSRSGPGRTPDSRGRPARGHSAASAHCWLRSHAAAARQDRAQGRDSASGNHGPARPSDHALPVGTLESRGNHGSEEFSCSLLRRAGPACRSGMDSSASNRGRREISRCCWPGCWPGVLPEMTASVGWI